MNHHKVFFALLLLSSIKAHSIVGGEFTKESSPITESTVGLSHGCTGTLIEDDVVVTAAHCLRRRRKIEVIFGTTFKDGVRIAIKEIVIHPDFTSTANGGVSPDKPAQKPIHDIALIKLNSPAPAGFSPAPLGSGQNLIKGDKLILAGFGLTAPRRGSKGRLKHVETIFNFYNEKSLEVVFGPTPGKSACPGDSGGPMYRERGNQLTLIGVTSRGFKKLGPCSGNGNYTEVEAHLNWIQETINDFNK